MSNNKNIADSKKSANHQVLTCGLSIVVGLVLDVITAILAVRFLSASEPEANAPALVFFPFLILLAVPLGLAISVSLVLYIREHHEAMSTTMIVLGIIGDILCLFPTLLAAVMFFL